jgi:hypothetical protein
MKQWTRSRERGAHQGRFQSSRTFGRAKEEKKNSCLHCWATDWMFTNEKKMWSAKNAALKNKTGSRMLTLITKERKKKKLWLDWFEMAANSFRKCHIGSILNISNFTPLSPGLRLLCLKLHAWQLPSSYSFSPSTNDPSDCFFIINNSFGCLYAVTGLAYPITTKALGGFGASEKLKMLPYLDNYCVSFWNEAWLKLDAHFIRR